MIYTIEFGKLRAMLLDFVSESRDGCYFLRMVGDEPTVNAIWARLSSRETRGKAWSSGVQIQIPGRTYPEYVALEKAVTYKTVRSRLPSGMIDLALIHPLLTLAEDDEFGFYVLSYAEDVPVGFFDRLNRTLAIPLQAEWTPWLWTLGQQPVNRWLLESKVVRTGGEAQEQIHLVEKTFLPITEIKSLGNVRCSLVRTEGDYQNSWLEIIRHRLELGIPLILTKQGYQADPWTVLVEDGAHCLWEGDDLLIRAPSLNYALTWANETLGLKFLVSSRMTGQ